MSGLLKQNSAVTGLVTAIVAVLALGAIIRIAGVRPYGEQSILEQIERDDSALCRKFGLATGKQQYADCMLDLADLRQRHVNLLISCSWL